MRKKFAVLVIIIAVALLIVSFNTNFRNTLSGIIEDPKSIEKDGGTIVVYEIIERDNEVDLEEKFGETKEIIKRRLKAFAISTSYISIQGDSKIKVEIPGETLSDNVLHSLIQSPKVEFRKVKKLNDDFVLPEMTIDDFDSEFVLDGKSIKDASVYDYGDGEIGVSIELDKNGANKFYESSLEKGQIAILLEDRVISAPQVDPKNPIEDGRMIISGEFTQEQAEMLAILIRAEQMPVKLGVLSKNTFSVKE